MQIYLDHRSGAAIYDQIYTQIKTQIISGGIQQDEALPSIRSLAKDLHISVITTKRAYDELEKEGYIYTVAGKGCFVAAQNLEQLREENLKKLEAHLSAAASLAVQCGLDCEDVVEMLRFEMEES